MKTSGFQPRRVAKALAVAIALGVALAAYATQVEPAWIEVTHYRIAAPASPPIKIAHLTDLHIRGNERVEGRLLKLLEEEKPDLIVITGDSLSGDDSHEAIRSFYARLHAPRGVYFVKGNWERGQPWVVSSPNVTVLNNQSVKLGERLYLVGLDDSVAGHPDLHAALKDVPADAFKIAIFHSPGFFHQAAGHVQLALAGHTHGGQVRIPGINPFWLPRGSGGYLHGWYEQDGSRLYVSRGIGMSNLPIRFLCRPELDIVTLGQ